MSRATTSQAMFRVLGENDDASECLCCGRQGLRKVVWLQPLDQDGNEVGEPVHFGRVCGAKAAGWGYGSDAGRIERRIRQEEREAVKHYNAAVQQRITEIERSGGVVRTRVACGFDWKSATHTYGLIFTLPGDPIAAIADPVAQQAEIKAAKARVRDRFPVYRAIDERLTAMELKALLAASGEVARG